MERFLHAISEPKRRAILRCLKEQGKSPQGKQLALSASDIEASIGLSQPTISHHMAILRRAGLVEQQKQGTWVWYSRNNANIQQLARELKELL